MIDDEKSLSGSAGKYLASFVILVVIPLIAHFRYSWMGFNPTDDGFILAYSRRIIEGQIPHLDFISIRPVGSPLLHLPFVLWGGDYTFWTSRLFVWFEFGVIAWVWTNLLSDFRRRPFDAIEKLVFGIIIFCMTVGNFPIMAWHTIDGILLSSVGLYLVLKGASWGKIIGYFLIGLAYLCKQNFGAVSIAALILLGDWRNWKYWIAVAGPGIIYGAYLLMAGALGAAMSQMTSQSDLLQIGVIDFINRYSFLPSLGFGYLTLYLLNKEPGNNKALLRYANTLGLAAVGAIAVACLIISCLNQFIGTPVFALFWITVGGSVYFIRDRSKREAYSSRYPVLILILAWVVSLSVGYNNPALAGGLMLALLLCYGFIYIQSAIWHRVFYGFIIFLGLATMVCFDYMRREFVYRDCSVGQLTQSLDGVLPGGNHIKTNPRTHEFLTDLRRAIGQTVGARYAIIPDCAGYWVKAEQANPLPIDWPQGTELNTTALLQRVTNAIERQRDSVVILTQKVMARSLNEEYFPQLENRYYAVVKYVHMNLTKVGETKFFEINK